MSDYIVRNSVFLDVGLLKTNNCKKSLFQNDMDGTRH